MKKKMNIFDVEIDSLTAKEAMQAAVQYLQSGSVKTIEFVTLDMLMNGQDSPKWKENTKEIDILLPGEREILEAAHVKDRGLLKDVSNRVFLKMFLRYLKKNRKKLFLLAASEQELDALEGAMGEYSHGIIIAGREILSEDGKSEENIINDINGAEIDCIFSVLPSPQQEDFVVRNSALLNARVWLGCSQSLTEAYLEKNASGVRRFFIKKLFRYQVGKQKKEKLPL